ncbi:UrcA family protein [Sphingomonas flavalba]|uniref:UrcA family protein n=1 Tax=Sphingomonas flavalba TaxID=2559804 RepID=UPI0039E0810A
MLTSTLTKAFTASAIAAASVALLPAAAHAKDGPRAAMVSHADLNLASATGRTVLDNRIGIAARAVCGRTGIVSLAERQEIANCVTAARVGAERRAVEVIARRTGDTRLAGIGTAGLAGR